MSDKYDVDFRLTEAQKKTLAQKMELYKRDGHYKEAYEYMATIVPKTEYIATHIYNTNYRVYSQRERGLVNWFSVAATTNSHSNSVADQALRSYTKKILMDKVGKDIFTHSEYNERSNKMAQNILEKIRDTGEVSLPEILNIDAQNFTGFSDKIKPSDWPGASFDWLALGGNHVESPTAAALINFFDQSSRDKWSAYNAIFMGSWPDNHPFHMSPSKFDYHALQNWNKLFEQNQHNSFFKEWWNLIRENFYHIIDPLVLDIDGDGIKTIGINGFDSTHFDHNKDGIQTATGWIDRQDALLGMDIDGDGKISNGRELFGDNHLLENGDRAETGYQALGQYDDNGDGRIDAQDAVFGKLRAWRDANQDGISQADELLTMEEAQVQALNLAHTSPNRNLGNGNTLARVGSYVRSDGTEREMGDLHFASNNMFSRIDTSGIALTEEQQALPNLKGMGRVMDLRAAA